MPMFQTSKVRKMDTDYHIGQIEKAVISLVLIILLFAGRCSAQWVEYRTVYGFADTVVSLITYVRDGDSYRIRGLMPENKLARLIGVDCPEVAGGYIAKTQPFGPEVADSVELLLEHKDVRYQFWGFDVYKRPLVEVYYMENGELVSVAETILSKGWGVYYSSSKLPKEIRERYKVLAAQAKKKKIGIYGKHPTMKDYKLILPRKWRKMYPMGAAQVD